MTDDVADYLPDRNEPLGGTVTFANGEYQFPLNLPVDKLKDVLREQAAQYGDELAGNPRPHIRVRRDDAVYDVGYRPDLETGERRATFVAKRDRYGQEMEAYVDLAELVEQTGLSQYGGDATGGGDGGS